MIGEDGYRPMNALNRLYWRGERFRVGKLVDQPGITSPGETPEELAENLRDTCRGMFPRDA